MELKFIGCGAAFNTKFGNNSAYFEDNDELFLIDCGELIFDKIIDILGNYNVINVMITHTHGDHIGSLASLILYCKSILNIPVRIIIGRKCKHKNSIKNILNLMGCDEGYEFIIDEALDNKYKVFNTIRFKETIHVSNLDCYGLIFETIDGVIYYSGDTKDLNGISEIVNSDLEIDRLYIDTCSYEMGPHIYIEDLKKIIPESIIKKVYCMHFDNERCVDRALDFGFNVIKNRN